MSAVTVDHKSTYFDFRTTLTQSRLRGLWRMMSGYHRHYVGATLALALSALGKTATFLLLGYYVDSVMTQSGISTTTLIRQLTLIAAGFILLAAIEGTFAYLSGRWASYTAEGVARRLRNFLFDHIQRLTFTYHSHTPTGDLIERCTSDVDAVRRFFSEQAIGVGRITALFVVNFAALLYLNPTLAGLSIIVLPLILAVSLWFFRRVTKAYEKYQEQEAVLSTTLQENLTGVRVVKAFARQDYENEKFEKDNFEKFRRGRRLLFMHSLFWPLSDIILGFQMLFGFVVAAMMAISGTITVGTYVA
jgi:ATP-binding cassette subfamily B protein